MRVLALVAAAVLAALSDIPALAEFAWPSALTQIGEEAFAGAALPASIALPEGVIAIGDGAFRDCATLREVTIPEGVSAIGEEAFAGCGEALLLHVAPGSGAMAYAQANQLDWEAGSVYRALVIAQNYTGTDMVLYGPANDARAVRFCLSNLGGMEYQTMARTNLTADELLTAIDECFGEATDADVSLFYYSGHGEADGSLVGSDGELIAPEALRSALDAVPGRKVVIADACYSGQLIAETTRRSRSVSGTAGFTTNFQDAFARRSRGVLNAQSYFVITAAQAGEESQEGYVTSGGGGRIMGYFTHGLCLGCGWNGVTNRAAEPAADVNADGAVSVAEAFEYARDFALSLNSEQNAALWPTDCRWFAPFRME